jgi:hypothetical protein
MLLCQKSAALFFAMDLPFMCDSLNRRGFATTAMPFSAMLLCPVARPSDQMVLGVMAGNCSHLGYFHTSLLSCQSALVV